MRVLLLLALGICVAQAVPPRWLYTPPEQLSGDYDTFLPGELCKQSTSLSDCSHSTAFSRECIIARFTASTVACIRHCRQTTTGMISRVFFNISFA